MTYSAISDELVLEKYMTSTNSVAIVTTKHVCVCFMSLSDRFMQFYV